MCRNSLALREAKVFRVSAIDRRVQQDNLRERYIAVESNSAHQEDGVPGGKEKGVARVRSVDGRHALSLSALFYFPSRFSST